MPTLNRTMGLLEASVYGVGLNLGAGIYAILGEAVTETGESIVVSFVLAAVVATLTGLSRAELANLGRLAVFVVVVASLLKLRYDGDAERGGYRAPSISDGSPWRRCRGVSPPPDWCCFISFGDVCRPHVHTVETTGGGG